MANTTITFTLDTTNTAHMTFMAQALASATPMGIAFTMGTDAPTPTPVSTPVAEPKVYAPAEDVQCKWVLDKTHVSYTLADGKYVGQSGVRKTLNARLRNAGADWDATKKVWIFKSSKAAQTFVESDVCAHYDSLDGIEYAYPTVVTASEIEAVRAKAQARALKKAQA